MRILQGSTSRRRLKRFSAVVLLFSGALALIAAARPMAGQEGGEVRKLVGTWNVTDRKSVV